MQCTKYNLFHVMTGVERPADTQDCYLPCPCQVSRWSNWSVCSVTCRYGHHTPVSGYQSRSRDVISGQRTADCPSLVETRRCDWSTLPQCKKLVTCLRHYNSFLLLKIKMWIDVDYWSNKKHAYRVSYNLTFFACPFSNSWELTPFSGYEAAIPLDY